VFKVNKENLVLKVDIAKIMNVNIKTQVNFWKPTWNDFDMQLKYFDKKIFLSQYIFILIPNIVCEIIYCDVGL